MKDNTWLEDITKTQLHMISRQALLSA